MTDIIDVSAAQRVPLDGGAIAASGIVAGIVRATLGRVTTSRDIDGACHAHANAFRAAGLDIGAYGLLFARHGRPQDADDQGRDLVRLWRELGGTLLPAIDVEREPGDEGVAEQEYLDAIRMYVDAVEAEIGRPPMLYVGSGWLAAHPLVAACTDLARCPWWSPDYGLLGASVTTPAPARPWTVPPALHQYAGGLAGAGGVQGRLGTCAGISGYVDRSRLLVGIDAVRC